MPATGAVHIVTGVPFSATFTNAANTFTITGVNVTSVFAANYILTVLGGSPNGGYRQIVSSTFTGGNTVVTSTPYSTGTVYPGPTNFTTGSGSVVWVNVLGPPPPTNIVISSGINSTGPFTSAYTGGDGSGWASSNLAAIGGGQSTGSVVGSSTVNGATLDGIFCSGSPGSRYAGVAMQGTHAQNFFSQISFTCQGFGSDAGSILTFTTASASYDTSTFPGETIWRWTVTSGLDDYCFGFGGNVTITFS